MLQEIGSLKSQAGMKRVDLLQKTSFISQLEKRLSDAEGVKRVSILNEVNSEMNSAFYAVIVDSREAN